MQMNIVNQLSLSGKTTGWRSSVRVFISFPTIVSYAIEDGDC